MKKMIVILAMLASVIGLQGCASYGVSPSRYTTSEEMRSAHTVPAVVVTVRRVHIVNSSNNMGGIIGGSLGGIAANAIGGGHGQMLATVAGAVVGAIMGSQAQNRLAGHQRALQITVVHRGSYHTVVQPYDGTHFHKGERVLVIQEGFGSQSRTRVEPTTSNA